MTQGTRQRLPRGEYRVERLVDAIHATRLEPTGDRQRLAQETLDRDEQREGVAVELPVVEELHAVEPPESGDAEPTLRHLDLDALLVAEQRDRSSPQDALTAKPEPAKQLHGIARARIRESATSDRLVYGSPDFGLIEIGDRPADSRLVLPTLIAVHPPGARGCTLRRAVVLPTQR